MIRLFSLKSTEILQALHNKLIIRAARRSRHIQHKFVQITVIKRHGMIKYHIFKVPDRDIVIITIRTFTNGHVNMPKVTLFGRSAEYALENISEGDAICAIGYAYTNRAEKSDGSREYYEGITCNSIALAPSEEEAMGG